MTDWQQHDDELRNFALGIIWNKDLTYEDYLYIWEGHGMPEDEFYEKKLENIKRYGHDTNKQDS